MATRKQPWTVYFHCSIILARSKKYGPRSQEFTKLAIIVLNQIVRPFTVKWHALSLQGGFDDPEHCKVFQQELRILQVKLMVYTRMLGHMAGVERDLTELED